MCHEPPCRIHRRRRDRLSHAPAPRPPRKAQQTGHSAHFLQNPVHLGALEVTRGPRHRARPSGSEVPLDVCARRASEPHADPGLRRARPPVSASAGSAGALRTPHATALECDDVEGRCHPSWVLRRNTRLARVLCPRVWKEEPNGNVWEPRGSRRPRNSQVGSGAAQSDPDAPCDLCA